MISNECKMSGKSFQQTKYKVGSVQALAQQLTQHLKLHFPLLYYIEKQASTTGMHNIRKLCNKVEYSDNDSPTYYNISL